VETYWFCDTVYMSELDVDIYIIFTNCLAFSVVDFNIYDVTLWIIYSDSTEAAISAALDLTSSISPTM